MSVQEAAQELLRGELVVFPTETVYGLGALATNENAVRRIFEVKGRPAHNPLILHIADNAQLPDLVQEISPEAKKLIDRFWPGPLTICFKKSEKVSDLVSAGLPTVCIRRPDHPLAQEFLKRVDQPVAAPSANISGKPSTTTYEDARKQLEQKGVFFLDGGKSPLGLESTVIDCSGETIRLLRPGIITPAEIEVVLGRKIEYFSHQTDTISSPGQLLDHYAPSGQLTVICGNPEQRSAWFSQQTFDPQFTWAFGLISSFKSPLPGPTYQIADSETNLMAYASQLYSFLNWCDQNHAEKIILELPDSHDSLQKTLLNRLEKASKGHIFRL